MIKTKKNIQRIRIHKRTDAEKNNDQVGKTLYKLMNDIVYGKTMENLRNTINLKIVKNKKGYLKCTSRLRYMSHKLFDNKLVTIRKSKFVLKLKKPAYIGMWILELSKVLMYEFHCDYIKSKLTINNNYYLQTLIF